MAASRNITVIKGDDYTHEITIEDADGNPWDLTSWTGEAYIRRVAATVGAPDAQFVVSFPTPLSGRVNLVLADTVTDTLVPGRDYEYDLELADGGGDKTTIMRGVLSVEQDVTHA